MVLMLYDFLFQTVAKKYSCFVKQTFQVSPPFFQTVSSDTYQ